MTKSFLYKSKITKLMINITAKKNPKEIATKEIAYKPHPQPTVHILYYIILHVQMFSNSN